MPFCPEAILKPTTFEITFPKHFIDDNFLLITLIWGFSNLVSTEKLPW